MVGTAGASARSYALSSDAPALPNEKFIGGLIGLSAETAKDFFFDPNFNFKDTGKKWSGYMSGAVESHASSGTPVLPSVAAALAKPTPLADAYDLLYDGGAEPFAGAEPTGPVLCSSQCVWHMSVRSLRLIVNRSASPSLRLTLTAPPKRQTNSPRW